MTPSGERIPVVAEIHAAQRQLEKQQQEREEAGPFAVLRMTIQFK